MNSEHIKICFARPEVFSDEYSSHDLLGYDAVLCAGKAA